MPLVAAPATVANVLLGELRGLADRNRDPVRVMQISEYMHEVLLPGDAILRETEQLIFEFKLARALRK